MKRLIKTGKIEAKSSIQIKNSKIGIGFEKLDRDVFDPEKAYDPVAELGVKWVRIQSGWQRTETAKGVYEFEWLDSIVDNLIRRGLKPWICLCYGNSLYDDLAKTVFGAVGCPPIFTEEQREAWKNYVKAIVTRYKGKVEYFEVWNEPDGKWCWRTGPNATELGEFNLATAKAVKEANPDAKVIGMCVCHREITFLNEALETGAAEYLDFISFHEYTADETKVFEKVKSYRALAKKYNPQIELVQGESGSQSRSGGHGALRVGAWTEQKQAKQLARHTIADLLTNVYFTSYFSCMDMVEALNGTVGDVSTYLDYGYFGVLGAEFDENGKACGTYYKKPSYYVLQNIASLFAEDLTVCDMPVIFKPKHSDRIFDEDLKYDEVICGGFEREKGEAFVFWNPTNIMSTSYEGTISFEIFSKYEEVRLIDVMDGSIYEIPESIMTNNGFGTYIFEHLPIKDTPMILVFGKF